MKSKKLFLVVLCCIILAAAISYRYYSKGRPKPEKQAKKETVVEPGKKKVNPSRPEDYGMMVTHGSISEEETQRMIAQKVKVLKSSLSSPDREKLKEKIKEDPKKTKEKLEKVDVAIRQCQEELAENPDNQAVKKRLQRLWTLKTIASELPK